MDIYYTSLSAAKKEAIRLSHVNDEVVFVVAVGHWYGQKHYEVLNEKGLDFLQASDNMIVWNTLDGRG